MTRQLHHPFSPEGLRDPHPVLAAYRRINPAYFDRGMNMWLLTGYDLCRAALRDPAFSAAAGQQQRARDDGLPVSMLNTDGDQHHRLRSPAAAAFSARAIERLTDDLREIAESLVLQTLSTSRAASGASGSAGEFAGQVDAAAAIAAPYASNVLGRLLGLEPSLWPELGTLAAAAAANLDPMVRGPAAVAARAASEQLTAFLRLHSRRLLAGDSPVDLAGLPADNGLSEAERLGVFSLTVIGGYEPLVLAITTALHLLLDRPALMDELRDDPTRIGGAFDEALRLESPIPFTARVCTSGFRLGDSELPPGAVVLAMVGAANRDPDVFADPDTFDAGRSPNPHLALGGAAHFCLGAPLVRRSAVLLLETMLTMLPDLRRSEAPTWRRSMVPRGLAHLPVLL